jgi:hypothetical protein
MEHMWQPSIPRFSQPGIRDAALEHILNETLGVSKLNDELI